ncbi:MAG: DUF1467 family protein [Pseudomonadota bacterium]
MNIGGTIVIFIILWWVVFLALLPMGVTARWESEDDGVRGAEPGAPVDPQLKRKAIRATAIASILTIIVSAIIAVISFLPGVY